MPNITREEVVLLKQIAKNTGPKYFNLSHVSTTTTGTIREGFHKVTIFNAGASDGTVTLDGVTITLPSQVSVGYSGGEKADISLDSISYNATGTTFIIVISRL